jgi:hypothetical protein
MSEKDDSLKPEIQDIVRKLAREEAANYVLHSGINNTLQQGLKPAYDLTTSEKLIDGRTNCFITLGNDRPSGEGSGYGGRADSACATIDLCSGHLGDFALDGKPAAKNFELDSARIYISQKTDIDANFKFQQYSVNLGNNKVKLENSEGKSAVGIKADEVRLLARNNIKIGTQHFSGLLEPSERLLGGVQIIAGVDNPSPTNIPQPMVKGDNLLELLQNLVSEIEKLQDTFAQFVDIQSEINNKFSMHVHQLDPETKLTDTMVSPISNTQIQKTIIPKIIKNVIGYQKLFGKYFTPANSKYINSKYNKVN